MHVGLCVWYFVTVLAERKLAILCIEQNIWNSILNYSGQGLHVTFVWYQRVAGKYWEPTGKCGF